MELLGAEATPRFYWLMRAQVPPPLYHVSKSQLPRLLQLDCREVQWFEIIDDEAKDAVMSGWPWHDGKHLDTILNCTECLCSSLYTFNLSLRLWSFQKYECSSCAANDPCWKINYTWQLKHIWIVAFWKGVYIPIRSSTQIENNWSVSASWACTMTFFKQKLNFLCHLKHGVLGVHIIMFAVTRKKHSWSLF